MLHSPPVEAAEGLAEPSALTYCMPHAEHQEQGRMPQNLDNFKGETIEEPEEKFLDFLRHVDLGIDTEPNTASGTGNQGGRIGADHDIARGD